MQGLLLMLIDVGARWRPSINERK